MMAMASGDERTERKAEAVDHVARRAAVNRWALNKDPIGREMKVVDNPAA